MKATQFLKLISLIKKKTLVMLHYPQMKSICLLEHQDKSIYMTLRLNLT